MTVKGLNMNLNLKSSSKCNAMKQEMREGLGKAKLASPDLLKYKKWEGEPQNFADSASQCHVTQSD